VGKKKNPMYRVVVADERRARDGKFIEIIGQYQPQNEPSVINIKDDRALYWLSQGAQPSETVQKLLSVAGIWEQHEKKMSPKTKAKLKAAEVAKSKAPKRTKRNASDESEAPAAEVSAEAEAPAEEAAPEAESE
jgi:small subunit ribosomal protein S16